MIKKLRNEKEHVWKFVVGPCEASYFSIMALLWKTMKVPEKIDMHPLEGPTWNFLIGTMKWPTVGPS